MDSYEFIEFCVCPVEQKSRLSSIQEISWMEKPSEVCKVSFYEQRWDLLQVYTSEYKMYGMKMFYIVIWAILSIE